MKTQFRESGQSIVFIAIIFVGLIAMAALIIDGGSLYLNRRETQTAADAAVLAGAYEMCVEQGSMNEIVGVVNQYAIAENGATAVDSVTIDEDGALVVETSLSTSTFFAQIFGEELNTARAQASAGCFSPGTMQNLLPVAWTCRPPVGGSVTECNIHSIPWSIFQNFLSTFNFNAKLLDEGDGVTAASYYDNKPGDGKMIYMVMDSNKFDPLIDCIELNASGQINCDFNDDGILDVEGGANRGWLLLDGTGASDLSQLMLNGFPGEISIPQWFPGKSGVSNSVFINAHQVRLKVALVPVFNAVCSDTTDTDIPSKCPIEFKTGDLIKSGSGKSNYYRVAGFAPFVITCVSKGASEYCPGKNLSGIKANTSTIEGYFVKGYIAGTGIDPGGFDLGVYILSLTK